MDSFRWSDCKLVASPDSPSHLAWQHLFNQQCIHCCLITTRIHATWDRKGTRASPTMSGLRSKKEGLLTTMSTIEETNGCVVLWINSAKGGGSIFDAKMRCFSQTRSCILPIGRVCRCFLPELSVIVSASSGEPSAMFVYQTEFSKRFPGSRVPFSPGIV